MEFIKKRDDIIENLKSFEDLLRKGTDEEKKFAVGQIHNSEQLLVYKVNGINHFAPCRFVAFRKMKYADWQESIQFKDDREVRDILVKIVGNWFTNTSTEEKYLEYAKNFDGKIARIPRMFWRIKDERGKNLDMKI
jgi:hypothetical protein